MRPMGIKAAPASAPTLRKLGADLRWLIEKSGLDPEKSLMTIGVPTAAAQQALFATFRREFDPAVMRVIGDNVLAVHGVFVSIAITPAVATLGNPYNKPIEPA